MVSSCCCSSELTQWKDVKQSGIVFASGILAYLAFMWVDFCPIQLVILLAQVAIIGCLVASFTAFRVQKKDEGELKEKVEALLDQAVSIAGPQVVSALMQANKVATMEDKAHSMKCFGIAFVLSYVFSLVSLTTLLLLGWIIAFTWPKVYETNQAKIDDACGKAHAQFAENVKKVPKLAEALGYNQKKSE